MSSDLKKAEQTCINAARAMVRLLDFATDVLREISKTVSVSNTYRMVRTEPVRFSTNDHYVLKRYTSGEGPGDLWPKRYIFAPFIMAHPLIQEAGGGRMYPFIHISLINSEDRAPSVLYGFLRDADGRERHQEIFLEHYLMWLNEGLNSIKRKATKTPYGMVIDQKLPARAETQMLTARVIFEEMPLLDINGANLPERANTIVDWFRTAVPASAPK